MNAVTRADVLLFPFGEYWWFYAGFTVFVCILLALAFLGGFYLFMLHRLPLDPRLTAIPGFDPGVAAHRAALEFLAGYVVEYSLSVDNIFVFVVVLGYFGVPTVLQHRVLFFGILGALVFRAIFIALGAALLRFTWVIWIFGIFLVFTGVRMMFATETEVKPEENALIRLFRRFVPVTDSMSGSHFFVMREGKRFATPLFVALLFLEMTDIVFAVDSVPAIFALTREPLIVFTSNIFAILGLRNLYFMLRGAIDKFYMLKYGLGVVLVFVGCKMTFLNYLFGGHFPISWSLGIIVGVIAISIVLSLLFPRPPDDIDGSPVGLPPSAELVIDYKEKKGS